MPPSAVVDASVLVSAYLFPASMPGLVVSLAEEKIYTLYLSDLLLQEVRRSLHNLQPSGSGSTYQGRKESFREHQDEAKITWGYDSPEMTCTKQSGK